MQQPRRTFLFLLLSAVPIMASAGVIKRRKSDMQPVASLETSSFAQSSMGTGLGRLAADARVLPQQQGSGIRKARVISASPEPANGIDVGATNAEPEVVIEIDHTKK